MGRLDKCGCRCAADLFALEVGGGGALEGGASAGFEGGEGGDV